MLKARKPVTVEQLTCLLAHMSLREPHHDATSTLPPSQQTTSQLSTLPTELISMICEALDDVSLLNFRLICLKLAAQSYSTFGSRFFDCLVAILHPTSFQILSKIAHHVELSKHVRSLVISSENETIGVPAEDWSWYTRNLSAILPTLPNLQIVRVDSDSYGYQNFRKEYTGIRCGFTGLRRPRESSFRLDYTGHCRNLSEALGATLVAFHESGANSRSSLDIGITGNGAAMDYELYFSNFPQVIDLIGKCVKSVSLRTTIGVPNILQHMKTLRRMVLNSMYAFMTGYLDSVLRASDNSLIVWPELSHWRIHNSGISHATLTGFLMAHSKTLVSIELQAVALWSRQGTSLTAWTQPFEIMRTMTQLENLKFGSYHMHVCGYRNPDTLECEKTAHQDHHLTLECHSHDAVLFLLDDGPLEGEISATFPSDEALFHGHHTASEAAVPGISFHVVPLEWRLRRTLFGSVDLPSQ